MIHHRKVNCRLLKTSLLLFLVWVWHEDQSYAAKISCSERSTVASRCNSLTNENKRGTESGAYPWISELRRIGVSAVKFEFEFLLGDPVREEFNSKDTTYFSQNTSAPFLIAPQQVNDAGTLQKIKTSNVEVKLQLWAVAEAKRSLQAVLQQQDWKRGSGNVDCVLRADQSEPSSVYIRSLDDPDVTALMLAAQSNRLAKVTELTSTSDVNAQDQDGNTALLRGHSASHQIIETLIRVGADVNAQNKSGESSLMQAAYAGNARAVEILLAHGADVTAVNSYRKTALGYALSPRVPSLEVVLTLVKAGADVNSIDDLGKTPLIYAVICGCPSIVDYLLSNGADASAHDKRGKTAMDYAHDANLASQSSKKLQELLERRAEPSTVRRN